MDFSITSNAAELIAELGGKFAQLSAATKRIEQKSAQRIAKRIPSNMHWKSGSGALAGSFYASSRGVESDLPYARRREFGFSGMTDSRGRTYTNDPGAFYMRQTLATAEDDVDASFTESMAALFG